LSTKYQQTLEGMISNPYGFVNNALTYLQGNVNIPSRLCRRILGKPL